MIWHATLVDNFRHVPTRRYRVAKTHKLQIIFHKRATKYRSLLRKMTYKDKASYESSPPYMTPLRRLPTRPLSNWFCPPYIITRHSLSIHADILHHLSRHSSLCPCNLRHCVQDYVSNDTSSIDHLVMREFVSGPPRYHWAIRGIRERFTPLRSRLCFPVTIVHRMQRLWHVI